MFVVLEGAPHNDAPDWTDWEMVREGAPADSEEVYILSRANEDGTFYGMRCPDSDTDAVSVGDDVLAQMREAVGL